SPGYRQFQPEASSAIRPVGNFDRAAMLLNDTVRDGKTEAGAFVRTLGGEEGIVDAAEMLGRDAVAGIRYVDLDGAAFPPRANFQSASARHGVAGVEEEIQEDLLELARVAVDGRQAGVEI